MHWMDCRLSDMAHRLYQSLLLGLLNANLLYNRSFYHRLSV